MKDRNLTLVGLLCFAKNRHKYRPQFTVQCASVNSTTLTGNNFTNNKTSIEGNLEEVFNKSISFIDRNLKKIPSGTSFNSPAVWEIPYKVFEELLVNALVHRDYFISATIKTFVFTNRFENDIEKETFVARIMKKNY
jgi:predicted HTH transcriptional regulator